MQDKTKTLSSFLYVDILTVCLGKVLFVVINNDNDKVIMIMIRIMIMNIII